MYIAKDDVSKMLTEINAKLDLLLRMLDIPNENSSAGDDLDTMLDNQDVCEWLHVSKRTLQRYRSSGDLPYSKNGNKTYYLKSDVKDFLMIRFKREAISTEDE